MDAAQGDIAWQFKKVPISLQEVQLIECFRVNSKLWRLGHAIHSCFVIQSVVLLLWAMISSFTKSATKATHYARADPKAYTLLCV